MKRIGTPSKTIKIEGQQYHWKEWAESSRVAKDKAQKLRERGMKVRIRKTRKTKHLTPAYNIYTRGR